MSASFASGLSWSRLEVVASPPRMVPVIVAEFPFRNDGEIPVKIVSVEPLCGCLKARVTKTLVAPGEGGSVRVEAPAMRGAERVTKTVRVTSDSGKPVVLRLVLEPPAAPDAGGQSGVARLPAGTAGKKAPGVGPAQPITMKSHRLVWKIGEAPVAKTLEVVVAADRHVTLGGLRSRTPAFEARLDAAPVLGLHRIVASPVSTAQAVEGVVQFEAIVEGLKRTYSARLVVE